MSPPLRKTFASALVVMLGCGPFAAGEAAADLKLCNYTPSRVGIAIGYKNTQIGQWITEGWWNVLSHSCETLIPGELDGRFYYVHAVDYDRGGNWSGKNTMCIADKSFTIKGVKDCEGRAFDAAGFYEVDTGEAKDYTIRLVDPGEAGTKKK